jgi:hypothetical protein
MFLAMCCYVGFSIWVLPKILVSVYGPNIEQQIDQSFSNASQRDFEIVVVGNSRLYCGVNPDQFTSPTYNFAHNNDSFNQMFYKLRWLLDSGKKINTVIVGVDYFQFSIFSDTRNYAYGEKLGQEYLRDYQGKNYWITYYKELLRPYKLRALVKDPIYRHDLKENGQFVRRGVPDERDFIRRNFTRLPIQVEYFERILEVCREHKIAVFLCMPPLRDVERSQYDATQVDDFKKFIASYLSEDVTYLDYSSDERFTIDDFIDFSHLSQDGADKFSRLLNDNILTFHDKR